MLAFGWQRSFAQITAGFELDGNAVAVPPILPMIGI